MANLTLKGALTLIGNLRLNPDGGKVLINSQEALVEGATGQAAPVIQPPPPASPLDAGVDVKVISSFNQTVTANGKALVTQGIVLQGNSPTWPGLMQPSQGNTGPVTVNGIPITVVGDKAMIFPSGGMATFNQSGQ